MYCMLGLKKGNPFKVQGCQFGDKECLINGKNDCSKMHSTYTIRCVKCRQDQKTSHPNLEAFSHHITLE